MKPDGDERVEPDGSSSQEAGGTTGPGVAKNYGSQQLRTGDSRLAKRLVEGAGRNLRAVARGDHDLIVYVGFACVVAFFGITLSDRGFLSIGNIENILRQSAPIAIMACAMVFVLSAKEIDLSIGSVVAFGALIAALTLRVAPAGVAALTGVVGASFVGMINAFLVLRFRIPSFLVTLGMMEAIRGVSRNLAGLESVGIRDESFVHIFGSGDILGMSVLIYWMAGAVIVAQFFYRFTAYGKATLAVGGNLGAARSVGIKIERVKASVLILSSAAAGLAGVLFAGRLHGARYDLGGEAALLTVLAAAVIGGTRLFGGRGSIIGALVGAVMMTTLNNGLVLMGLDSSEQMIVRGVVIIVAVALSLREKRT